MLPLVYYGGEMIECILDAQLAVFEHLGHSPPSGSIKSLRFHIHSQIPV